MDQPRDVRRQQQYQQTPSSSAQSPGSSSRAPGMYAPQGSSSSCAPPPSYHGPSVSGQQHPYAADQEKARLQQQYAQRAQHWNGMQYHNQQLQHQQPYQQQQQPPHQSTAPAQHAQSGLPSYSGSSQQSFNEPARDEKATLDEAYRQRALHWNMAAAPAPAPVPPPSFDSAVRYSTQQQPLAALAESEKSRLERAWRERAQQMNGQVAHALASSSRLSQPKLPSFNDTVGFSEPAQSIASPHSAAQEKERMRAADAQRFQTYNGMLPSYETSSSAPVVSASTSSAVAEPASNPPESANQEKQRLREEWERRYRQYNFPQGDPPQEVASDISGAEEQQPSQASQGPFLEERFQYQADSLRQDGATFTSQSSGGTLSNAQAKLREIQEYREQWERERDELERGGGADESGEGSPNRDRALEDEIANLTLGPSSRAQAGAIPPPPSFDEVQEEGLREAAAAAAAAEETESQDAASSASASEHQSASQRSENEARQPRQPPQRSGTLPPTFEASLMDDGSLPHPNEFERSGPAVSEEVGPVPQPPAGWGQGPTQNWTESARATQEHTPLSDQGSERLSVAPSELRHSPNSEPQLSVASSGEPAFPTFDHRASYSSAASSHHSSGSRSSNHHINSQPIWDRPLVPSSTAGLSSLDKPQPVSAPPRAPAHKPPSTQRAANPHSAAPGDRGFGISLYSSAVQTILREEQHVTTAPPSNAPVVARQSSVARGKMRANDIAEGVEWSPRVTTGMDASLSQSSRALPGYEAHVAAQQQQHQQQNARLERSPSVAVREALVDPLAFAERRTSTVPSMSPDRSMHNASRQSNVSSHESHRPPSSGGGPDRLQRQNSVASSMYQGSTSSHSPHWSPPPQRTQPWGSQPPPPTWQQQQPNRQQAPAQPQLDPAFYR